MAGIRDLSIIATPPARRLSVKTFVRQYDQATIKEAILREILRGGQVYYLYNEVKNIDRIARELGELVPEARRSEEHTSELQSRGHLVCRILLENKKIRTTNAYY